MSIREEAELALAFDIPRVFASQVTYLPSDDGTLAMLVFKEVARARMEDVEGKPTEEIAKNVASIVMPASVMPKFRDILMKHFPLENEQDGAGGKPA